MTVPKDLKSFLDDLDRAGELITIKEPVSVSLEIAEIADRVMKMPDGGKAMLFENVILHDGSKSTMPVAINIFGSWKRMAMALGVKDVSEHGDRIGEMLKPDVPKGFWAKVQMIPKFAELAK